MRKRIDLESREEMARKMILSQGKVWILKKRLGLKGERVYL